jgi:hypothetical protein
MSFIEGEMADYLPPRVTKEIRRLEKENAELKELKNPAIQNLRDKGFEKDIIKLEDSLVLWSRVGVDIKRSMNGDQDARDPSDILKTIINLLNKDDFEEKLIVEIENERLELELKASEDKVAGYIQLKKNSEQMIFWLESYWEVHDGHPTEPCNYAKIQDYDSDEHKQLGVNLNNYCESMGDCHEGAWSKFEYYKQLVLKGCE